MKYWLRRVQRSLPVISLGDSVIDVVLRLTGVVSLAVLFGWWLLALSAGDWP